MLFILLSAQKQNDLNNFMINQSAHQQIETKPSIPQPKHFQVQTIDFQSQNTQKQRDRKIKKLTQIQKELVSELKSHNKSLNSKIVRQQSRQNRSVAVETPLHTADVRKQLSNVYRQIQMYKSTVHKLNAKQVSQISHSKNQQLESQLVIENRNIEELQKELRYVTTAKQQQLKEIQTMDNPQVRQSFAEMEQEVVKLKETLKTAKKQAEKRREVDRRLHSYAMDLEKELRKINGQYYPSSSKAENKQQKPQVDPEEEITESQWHNVLKQLTELKMAHQEYSKKIDLMNGQRISQKKGYVKNEEKVTQHQKKIQQIKKKIGEMSKLGKNQKIYQQYNNSDIQQFQPSMIPVAMPKQYTFSQGKAVQDSTSYSDKVILKQLKKTKIYKVQVWSDEDEAPCLVRFHYKDKTGLTYQGIQPYPSSYLEDYEHKVIQFEQDDHLHSIEGYFQKGLLSAIRFGSKKGKEHKFNSDSRGTKFSCMPLSQELPTCLSAATIVADDDIVKMCYLGIQISPQWW